MLRELWLSVSVAAAMIPPLCRVVRRWWWGEPFIAALDSEMNRWVWKEQSELDALRKRMAKERERMNQPSKEHATLAGKEYKPPPGWDERHYTYRCHEGCGEHSSFWRTVTESPQWREWEQEVGDRLCAQRDDVFDVDECRECGWISAAHWQAFCAWLAGRSE